MLSKRKTMRHARTRAYLDCVGELLSDDTVRSMQQYSQHRTVDCLKHSLNVSVASFSICKWLGLDYRSAARGGLLHDFFLYDWHRENPHGGLHGFTHPKIAAENAARHFSLNEKEMDVILKHMWPLTLSLPRYAESYVVVLVDKYFCVVEAFISRRNTLAGRLHQEACLEKR